MEFLRRIHETEEGGHSFILCVVVRGKPDHLQAGPPGGVVPRGVWQNCNGGLKESVWRGHSVGGLKDVWLRGWHSAQRCSGARGRLYLAAVAARGAAAAQLAVQEAVGCARLELAARDLVWGGSRGEGSRDLAGKGTRAVGKVYVSHTCVRRGGGPEVKVWRAGKWVQGATVPAALQAGG